jgi:hypothetical protein
MNEKFKFTILVIFEVISALFTAIGLVLDLKRYLPQI